MSSSSEIDLAVRLREHVERRGGLARDDDGNPVNPNGAWAMMVQASDLIFRLANTTYDEWRERKFTRIKEDMDCIENRAHSPFHMKTQPWVKDHLFGVLVDLDDTTTAGRYQVMIKGPDMKLTADVEAFDDIRSLCERWSVD